MPGTVGWGVGTWVVFLLVAGFRGTVETEISRLFLLGPLVVVPLGIHLSNRILGPGDLTGLDRWIGRLWAPCAVLAVVSFVPPKIPVAGALTVPWVGFTALLALRGLLRILSEDWRRTSRICLHAGWMFIPVGAGWLFLSRCGIEPMDFSPEIVLLTAVHFHFAGFALPILLACWATASEADERAIRPLGAVILLGIPALAFGITASPLVEVIAAWGLAVAVNVFGVLLMLHAMKAPLNPGSRVLIFAAGAAGSVALLLSGVYAAGEFLGREWISIPWMVRTHGVLNGIVLAVGGLVGFALSRPKTSS